MLKSSQRLFVPLMLLLVTNAWLILWAWGGSPYGAYLHHGSWMELGATHGMHHGQPASGPLLHGLLYIGGWLLMTTAMMLPTSIPLLEAYRRLTSQRSDRILLLSLVIAGYLGSWLVFGFVAHGLDWLIRDLSQTSTWITDNGWVISAIVFAIAGLFQFSPLKYRCLDQCRAPLSFVTRHWTGQHHQRHALLLGLDHGFYCIGCCWALMLLMFAVGAGSLGWMLLLGAVMAAEKNLPYGRRLAAPLGGALLAGAMLMVLYHLGLMEI
jgi:predicted metal-binding membrane protein